MALAIGVIVVLGVGAALMWNFYLRPAPPMKDVASEERMAYPLPDKPSIAVLPFENLNRDPEQEYFVDGMTDDLITDLSKISGLLVIARNSSFTYKGKTVKVQQVGKELGVRYVLEGSVRKAGNDVRINAQLIDATVNIVSAATGRAVGGGRTYTSESSNPKAFVLEPGEHDVTVQEIRGERRKIRVTVPRGETVERMVDPAR